MVSVVIPTKDDEKVFKAIERAKDERPDEIIVVNDTESSEKYCEKLQDISGVKYVEVKGGTAKARNKGAEKASSEKIIFLDSDCYPTEGWKEKMSQALDDVDIAEGKVEYIGERTPFSRLVENKGEEGHFLTANLGVRKEVFQKVKFDENYAIFREDTDFGLRALEQGFKSKFVDAKVEHDAGKRTFRKFIQDQLRYETEPYFYQKFRGNEKLGDHVAYVGPVLYPKELAFEGLIAASILLSAFNPLALSGLFFSSVVLSSYYSYSAMREKNAEFSLADWFRGPYTVPIGIFAKRYAIWKGALRYGVLVI
ncbi:MAG: glycosyltransferase family 2 protein [Candidatus Nanohalobium sp.]